MREIIFRAWDKKKKKMREVKQLTFYLNDRPTEIFCHDGYFGDIEDFELMQFTGLYDRKGRRIWEGDLVLVLNYLNGEIWEGHTHIDEVIFTHGRFDLRNPWCHESLYTNTVEVVGNIWEKNDNHRDT